MSCITSDIDLVIERLSMGDIAAIPTETVYGLAADAFSDSAIKKVFSTKKRPIDHPLIMHIAPQWDLTQWVSHIPDYAYALIEAFWPGPLTLILPIKPGAVNPLITGGQTSIAIRAPNHAVAQELLLKFGKPLVAPSANAFGKISPTTAQHVQQGFPMNDFLILEGGRCSVGVESTIVSALEPLTYEIARPGIIDQEKIAATTSLKGLSGSKKTRVPGALDRHYQPEKKLYYVDDIGQLSHWLENVKTLPYVLAFSKKYQGSYGAFYAFPDTSEDAAYELYYRLRIADQSEADFILIELPPKGQAWFVIRERILKAGTPMNLAVRGV
jgi:L-threonylcarbamoyladenylate synthase